MGNKTPRDSKCNIKGVERIMYILGLAPGHNSTAALLKDGEIRYAMSEERLSRFKGDTRFPKLAIKRILEMEGIGLADIDHFVIHSKDITSFDLHDQKFFWDDIPRAESVLYKIEKSQLLSYLIYAIPKIGSMYRSESVKAGERLFYDNIKKFGIDIDKLMIYDHHMSHAAGAYYTCNADPCLIVTLDASGDGLSASINIGKDGAIERIDSTPVTSGTSGGFYSAVTQYLGYTPNRHEGKILGLAAYGDIEKCYDKMVPLLSYDSQSRQLSNSLNSENGFIEKLKLKMYEISQIFQGRKTNRYHTYCENNFSSFSKEDLAAAAQKRLEDVIVEYVRTYVEETGIKDVVLAGGVFSNVKLNQRIFEDLSLNSIFIHPDMTDGGCALGSAFLKWRELNDFSLNCKKDIEDVYWGQSFTNEDISQAIKRNKLKAAYIENIEEHVADLLTKGKVIGYFGTQGMEYGPRALGNRSIIAAATDNKINDWLNERLKRTEFMPFAPVVLEEEAPKILKNFTSGNRQAAKFMTITFDVTDFCIEKAPAIVHIDSTARPQTINEKQNPSYYKILKFYNEKTGIPCMINTSFNVHEEPIVCTPEDAIKSFREGRIDILVMGNWLIESHNE